VKDIKNISLMKSEHTKFLQCLGIRGYIQKFPDWPRGSRTANGTTFCHWMQLFRYFVSQSSEFCRHNHLCCFWTSVYCCKHTFLYDSVRKHLDNPRIL